MTEEAYDLDREMKVSNNIDALDKKWEIKLGRGSSLYFTRPNPDRSDMVIPKQMQGKWTKPELLQNQINLYLKESWDKADAATAKAERAKQAAKEQKKLDDLNAAELLAATVEAAAKVVKEKVAKPKATKVKNDSGSTNK